MTEALTRLTQTQLDAEFMRETLCELPHSDDPKARLRPQSAVAAMIVKNGIVLSKSANVLPPTLKDAFSKGGFPVLDSDRYYVLEHAERAAIFKALLAGEITREATMYCSRFPCSDCARAVVWAGIGRFVVSAGFGRERMWLPSQRAALRILRTAGITVRYLPQGASAT